LNNTLHGNRLAQLRLLAPDVTAGLGLYGVDCGAGNSFFCYPDNAVGVEVIAGSSMVLMSQAWAHATPLVDVDYKGAVTVTEPCAPASCP
jgi:hypothetical protein